MSEVESAAKMVKSGTYGMLYGGGVGSEEMVWTGIQRLLVAKGLDVSVDGKPGFRTYKALEQLATEGLADLDKRTGAELENLEPEKLEPEADETDEVDSVRFRRLEK
jgi:hypothetical protein